jgi:Arc/MetJ family transcription regulator
MPPSPLPSGANPLCLYPVDNLLFMYNNTISKICIMELAMIKTTVMINEQLLKEAMEVTGARSKREAIEAGLQSLVKQYNRETFRKELGTFDIDLTLNELEQLRHAD